MTLYELAHRHTHEQQLTGTVLAIITNQECGMTPRNAAEQTCSTVGPNIKQHYQSCIRWM